MEVLGLLKANIICKKYLFCRIILKAIQSVFSPFHVGFWIHPCTWLEIDINVLVILLSCVDTFPLPRNTMAGLTVCLLSALIQNCRVASLLSRPEPGWETQICLLPEKSYVLSCSTTKGRGAWSTLNLCFGIHRPYFLSGTALLLLLLDLTVFLKFLWNFWIVSLAASAECCFLFVLRLKDI